MSVSVLVVDDDPAFRGLVGRLLTEWGYQVVGESSTVAEAATLAGRLQPQIALVDIALPDGNGFDLAVRLSAMPTPVRVVLVSADSDPAYAAAAQRAGGRGFLAKDELTSASLREMLQGHWGP
jgi:DNA-binding NarL/FixJ family response regulator